MAEPFYLTTRRFGGNYYAKFRLEDGSISSMKCTGTSNYEEAKKIAYSWLISGEIPSRGVTKNQDKKKTILKK